MLCYTLRMTSLRVTALALAGAFLVGSDARPTAVLSAPPQVRPVNGVSSLTLTAAARPDGRAGMQFDGAGTPPTIRVWPGGRMKIAYANQLPVHSTEKCALGTCMDMTN